MLVGIDFDNTLVCYDGLFHRAAVARGLLSEACPADKQAVRDELRRLGREEAWTELQGEIYGGRIREARPFPGVTEFLRDMSRAGVDVAVISHRTRFPYLGEQYDLHQAARDWLRQWGISGSSEHTIAEARIHFEETREAKFQRIASCRCDVFIDDLPEFLGDAAFPGSVERILFDPQRAHSAEAAFRRFDDWESIAAFVLRKANL